MRKTREQRALKNYRCKEKGQDAVLRQRIKTLEEENANLKQAVCDADCSMDKPEWEANWKRLLKLAGKQEGKDE